MTSAATERGKALFKSVFRYIDKSEILVVLTFLCQEMKA